MNAPLNGIRVLDMSRILAGPWSAQTFADLGAEVIKIERPGTGDDTRSWGPPFLKDQDGNDTGEAAYFNSANRGKKSLTLDIADPEGQELVRRLAAKSDVLLENYKAGGLARYGLGYEDIKKVNPGIVYCSITGFGQTGPYKDRAGYDFMIQGMGGIMSVTGEADDKPGGGPQKIGIALTDILTGLYTTIAALSALRLRDVTGVGQHVDMALLDVTAATMANQAMNYLVTGEAPGRLGNAHPNIVPYQAFATADHYVIIAVGNDGQYQRFVDVGGRPELATDPRFLSNADRVENRDILVPMIEEMMLSKTREAWMKELEEVGVPCGPINDLKQLFDDPQVKARGTRIELPHPLAGMVPQVANPIKFSDAELSYTHAAPLLGQHTEDILMELLELDDEEIARLKDAGII